VIQWRDREERGAYPAKTFKCLEAKTKKKKRARSPPPSPSPVPVERSQRRRFTELSLSSINQGVLSLPYVVASLFNEAENYADAAPSDGQPR
jgi:hypothetical protein